MTDDASRSSSTKRKLAEGRPPPTDPDFFLKFGLEIAKSFVPNANTALSQLLTLSTALLGGTIAFWNYIPIALVYRFGIVILMLITVFICLFSAMPTEGRFNYTNPSDIRSYMEYVFAYKARRLRLARGALTLTLMAMIGGLLVTAWQCSNGRCQTGANTPPSVMVTPTAPSVPPPLLPPPTSASPSPTSTP